MYLISAERYKNAGVRFLRVRNTSEIWWNLAKYAHKGLGVKNMSNFVWSNFKKICGIYEIKNLKNKQIKKIQNDWKRNFWKIC